MGVEKRYGWRSPAERQRPDIPARLARSTDCKRMNCQSGDQSAWLVDSFRATTLQSLRRSRHLVKARDVLPSCSGRQHGCHPATRVHLDRARLKVNRVGRSRAQVNHPDILILSLRIKRRTMATRFPSGARRGVSANRSFDRRANSTDLFPRTVKPDQLISRRGSPCQINTPFSETEKGRPRT